MASLLASFPTPARATILLLPWTVLLLLADVLLSLLLPLSAFFPTLVYELSSQIAYLPWLGIQSIFTQANSASIQLSSTSSVLPRHESAIVVSNHVAWTDFYMIQALAVRAGMLSRCRWFSKSQLRWVPLLGWGLWAMGMPLVTRNWTQDRAEMGRVFGSIRAYQWPICESILFMAASCGVALKEGFRQRMGYIILQAAVHQESAEFRKNHPKISLPLVLTLWQTGLIAYSEATRFTTAKHAAAVRWCEENNRPPPKHTLWPRYRGFVATVTQLRHARQVRSVYDVTIAYAARQGGRWTWMATPSFTESISRPGLDQRYRFYVDVQRFELQDLPEGEAELRQWLEQRWLAKDKKLDQLKEGLERGLWDGRPL
jgi:1-acyl-sn-glycerol-3-phosphate acyltransferase